LDICWQIPTFNYHIFLKHSARRNLTTQTKHIDMAIPDYGAAPLAKTFVLARALSIVSMIAIIGMSADFVAQIVGSDRTVPQEIIGTLVSVSQIDP
jgi:hypothetical protein